MGIYKSAFLKIRNGDKGCTLASVLNVVLSEIICRRNGCKVRRILVRGEPRL